MTYWSYKFSYAEIHKIKITYSLNMFKTLVVEEKIMLKFEDFLKHLDLNSIIFINTLHTKIYLFTHKL